VVPTQAVADAAVVGGNAGEGPAVEYAVIRFWMGSDLQWDAESAAYIRSRGDRS